VKNRIAVVGGGWAGLAAAIRATEAGHQVTLIEMAPQFGGRARSLPDEPRLDNGQHILIGAYRESLALLRRVGVDPAAALLRTPLRLRYPEHEGLRLPPGPPLPAFARAVLGYRAWPWSARLALLRASTGWALGGFRCDAALSVDALCRALPAPVRNELIDPLCIAALNTPAGAASAQVFLRVLRDALFSGPGSADLLLPRRPLSELLAEPAAAWLRARGAELRTARRVERIEAGGRVDGEAFDAAVLACSATEAARLAAPLNADWAAQARELRFEPIVTVYLESPGSALPAPMLALHESADAPAQFVFDLGQISGSGHAPGRFAFVISGAAPWIERGLDAAGAAVLAQARQALRWHSPPTLLRSLAEKRATFACTPNLQRPPARIAPGLWAAGDYVDGPYPATLEGAVRAGLAAAQGAAGSLA
jgi:squalene-associated FAD-dependent desaturase